MNSSFQLKLHVFFILACLQTSTNAAKILGIFTLKARSHFMYHHAIMESLADAGHQITMVSPFPRLTSYSNITYIDSRPTNTETPIFDFKHDSWPKMCRILIDEFWEKECYDLMKTKVIQTLLGSSAEAYDVMFVEMFYMYECYLPIAKKLAIPVIGTLSIRPWANENMDLGNPLPFVTPFAQSDCTTRMSFFQRLKNFMYHCYQLFVQYFIIPPKLDTFYKQHYPTYDDKQKSISLLFSNSHASILPSATVPTVLEIGGVHIKPAKPLPWKLQKFIEEAKYGVILFTMGTFASTSAIEPTLVTLFVDTFARIPQRVIWRWDGKIPNLSNNVFLSSWLPQRDILAHKNVKAFLTHTGINGVFEAITEAKPLIMIPLFGDQRSNAAILEEHGVGVRLHFPTLTKEGLVDAINTVLNNRSYIEQMKKLSQAFTDRPMTPQQTVVYWTEYVLRHNGTRHLRPTIADMPFYSYYLLDILVFLLISVFVTAFTSYYVTKLVYKRTWQNKKIIKRVKTD